MPLSLQLFASYWYGQGLRELAQAQRPDATPSQRETLPLIRERIRLHERLVAKRITSEHDLAMQAKLARRPSAQPSLLVLVRAAERPNRRW